MPIVKTSKEEVLYRATLVIRQRGYAKATMKELADACQVQPSLFYYYFKSKEELMSEVLNFTLTYFRERVFVYADDATLTPVEKLEKILKRIAKIFAYSDGGCLMSNTALETGFQDPEFLAFVRQFFSEFMATLTKIYQVKYAETYARSLAEQVIQDVEGGVMLSVLYKDEKYMMNALKRGIAHLS
jgi:TetR/AcrR family transcriptional regulator, transcriptional repressor for nem operon